MKTLTVYTKPNCPYCVAAKEWLDSNSIPYEVVDISMVSEAKEFVVSEGHKTVPQLYIGDELLVYGGYIGLCKMTSEEVINRLL